MFKSFSTKNKKRLEVSSNARFEKVEITRKWVRKTKELNPKHEQSFIWKIKREELALEDEKKFGLVGPIFFEKIEWNYEKNPEK